MSSESWWDRLWEWGIVFKLNPSVETRTLLEKSLPLITLPDQTFLQLSAFDKPTRAEVFRQDEGVEGWKAFYTTLTYWVERWSGMFQKQEDEKMPTGLTAPIYADDSMTAEQFLWRCARHFGALGFMRDDPANASIPETVVVSPYYYEAVTTAQRQLAEIEAMSDQEVEARAHAQYEEERKFWQESRAKAVAMRRRYDALIADVETWEPPSSKHTSLKDFALTQLRNSREADCPVRESPEPILSVDWREDQLTYWTDQLAYAQQRLQEKEDRAREATEWIQQLRASLSAETRV